VRLDLSSKQKRAVLPPKDVAHGFKYASRNNKKQGLFVTGEK